MSRTRLLIVALLSALVAVASVSIFTALDRTRLGTAAAESSTAKAKPAVRKSPRFNVALSASSATIRRGRDGITRLVLTGVGPRVEMADVSPGTERLAIPTWLWVREWRGLYRGYEPNSVLVWRANGQRQTLSFKLASGRVRGRTLSFELRRLAIGTKRALPLTAAVVPGRVLRVKDADLFVDPQTRQTPVAQGIVNQMLQTFGAMPTSGTVLTVNGSGTIGGRSDGAMYDELNVNASPVTISVTSAAAFAGGSAAGDSVTFLTPSGVGAYLRNFNAQNGAILLGEPDQSAIGMILDGANLTGGELWLQGSAEPQGTMVVNSTLTNATVRVANASGAIFANSNLSGSTWIGTGAGMFEGASFLGNDFSGASLQGIDFTGSTIAPWQAQSETGAVTTTNPSFAGAAIGSTVGFGSLGNATTLLQSVDFTGTSFTDTPFYGATLSGCTFAGAAIGGSGGFGTAFVGATIANTTFQGATISNASFSNANLQGADFSLATFTGRGGAVSFTNAQLGPGTVFMTTSGILNANFSGAQFDGVVFASGGGDPATPFQVSSLLMTIDSTTTNGVIINNVQYVKSTAGQVYQVSTDGAQWQPVTVTLRPPYVQNGGDPVPAGGNQPNPAPDPANGGGGGDGPGGGDVEFGQ